MASNFGKALGTFAGFRGAQIPKDPTNEAEYTALVNAIDGGSIWSGVVPTWSQVETKLAEFDAEDEQKVTDKVEGRAKLIELGLSEAQIDAITGQ